jgi:hypothetical protein
MATGAEQLGGSGVVAERGSSTRVLVEIEPEGGRRHNSPLIVSLPSLLPRSYFHYSRRGKEMRKYLTEKEMKQGNT